VISPDFVGSTDTTALRFGIRELVLGVEPGFETFKGSQMMDPAIATVTDSLGDQVQVGFYIARVRGDQTVSAMDPFPYDYSRQDLFLFARRSNGEELYNSSLVLSPDGSPITTAVTISNTFLTSGASFSFKVDFSGLSFEPFESVLDNAKPSAIGFSNIKGVYSAKRAVNVVLNRIENLSSVQGSLGALESRLRVAQSVLGASGENFAAASSRIKDADIAAESANVVRTQILQQTSASLLGQANLAPQIGLQLLQNA